MFSSTWYLVFVSQKNKKQKQNKTNISFIQDFSNICSKAKKGMN